MRLRFLPGLAVLSLTLGLAFASTGRAQTVEVIRGQVIGPDSAPITHATVTATMISGGVTREARTDRSGRYTITFPGGDGDYMISVAALGFAARQFQLRRIADEEVLIGDVRLRPAGVVLDAVQITAQRQVVPRTETAPDLSGTEQPITPAALAPADLGDLAAMAATLPGVSLVPGAEGDPSGFSVLGLGADQNTVTLNGMAFGGDNLPRDAMVSSGLATSPFDVSRGGFSGAQMGLSTRPGTNFMTRGASLNLDAPQLQWTDRAAQALGQQYTNASLGGRVSGPIQFNRAFYSLAYQLGRRSSDWQSLLNTDPVGLRAAGVSPDSVSRLLEILGAAEIPVTLGGRPFDSRATDQASLLGSIDIAPPSARAGQAFNLTFNGGWNRQNPLGGAATSLPASSGERSRWNAGVQGRHNAYFGVGILSETTVGVSGSVSESSPFLAMPAGRVQVNSVFDDGSGGVQNIGFGGSSFMRSHESTRTASAMNHLSWFSQNSRHRLRLTSELRHDRSAAEQAGNLFGTFSFNSLADVEDGQPSTFTRTLSPRQRSAERVAGSVSLGDVWRVRDRLQFQFGVRADANRYLDAPAYNRVVEELFGVRNDRSPSGAYLSPRAGFSWSYGNAPQVSGFAGAARAPRATVRGGVGIFRNLPGAGLIGPALDGTGLPGAVQQLTCVGPAAPVPDWAAYAADPSAIPSVCADGTMGTVFSNVAPNVTLFAHDYSPTRSVRSNLQWSGAILDNRFRATIDGTYSLNLNQPSTVDLNFDPAARFTLGEEGGRPVFVQPSSIVPSTGAIAWREARVSPTFSRVTEMRSDLRSESRQISLRVSPARFTTSFSWGASYVLSDVRQQVRGFTSTVSNPFDVEWASGFTSRHQIGYNLGYNLFDVARLNWFGQFRSGMPFTPMIAGDVNGDGYGNDRAFIFDPATTADPALASAMQSLLESGSPAARECLRRQAGRLAGRNSCSGPWTSVANLGVTLNPVKVRMPQRATISFNLSNPLGAADLMLHGSNGLRGWGQTIMPDQSLLYVRGFDPGTQRYRYEVNQRFGSTSPATSAFRAPVTLTAMMRFDLGPARERQTLTMQLDRGRRTEGTRLPESALKAIYGMNVVPNPMAQILRQQDTLRLSSAQADSIASINRWYLVRMDSIWTPVARYLAELPESYDQDEVWRRYLAARRTSLDLLATLAPDVKGLLTSEQRRRLPANVAAYLEPRYLASIRSGTTNFAGASSMPIMGQGAAGAIAGTTVIQSGGTVEIRRVQ